jgi:hypothetical protein
MARPPKIPVPERAVVMTAKELRTALRQAPSTFARHAAAGEFDRFELKPRIGWPRYSRRLVEQYLNGEPVYTAPDFERKAGKS